MSEANANTFNVGRRCSQCRREGHRADGCPDLIVEEQIDELTTRASLRMRVDALEISLAEHRRVRDALTALIEQDVTELALARARLEELREQ